MSEPSWKKALFEILGVNEEPGRALRMFKRISEVAEQVGCGAFLIDRGDPLALLHANRIHVLLVCDDEGEKKEEILAKAGIRERWRVNLITATRENLPYFLLAWRILEALPP